MTKVVVTRPKNSTKHMKYHYESAENRGKGSKVGKRWGARTMADEAF